MLDPDPEKMNTDPQPWSIPACSVACGPRQQKLVPMQSSLILDPDLKWIRIQIGQPTLSPKKGKI
jgi:hypothetical protein